MSRYSQANRPLRVTTTLGADALLLLGFTGREAISHPFSFQLDLLSENPEIDPRGVLRSAVTLTVDLPDGSQRFVHGLVSRFSQLGAARDAAYYSAEIVPWLSLLSLSRDCRIFQERTVLEILEEVFESNGYTAYEIACARSYPRRDYCVQYRESHLDFVSRLMEEEGIYYFFKHTEGEHVLVLADTNGTIEPCPGAATVRVLEQPGPHEDAVTRLSREDTLSVGKVTLGDYDPLQPSLTLLSSISGSGREEVYDFQPVIYTDVDEGDRYARVQLEAEEARQRLIRGEGTCRAFQPGFRVDIQDHYRPDMNAPYLLTEIRHSARGGGYGSSDVPFAYTNKFAAIPFDVPYRPHRTKQKPGVRGSQTATVVGKAGEEIWTDRYGRVKVQFHWDRAGKKDENSSCWVRVSTAWAGKGWGALHLPRIGQEVLVDFIEGDIDRPVIVGSLHNAEQPPPYDLPADQTQSGVRSRSSKGGAAENYNEIRFEDRKGSELLYVHAEKDEQVVVENDRIQSVANDETITIGGDRTEEVMGDRAVEIGGGEKRVVGGSRSTSVKNSDKLEVGAKVEVGARAIEVKAGAKIVLQATGGIELRVGASSVKITPAGVEIAAPQIKLDGKAQVELKAPIVAGQAGAMLQMKGAIAQVNGDGMLTVRGGITMIN